MEMRNYQKYHYRYYSSYCELLVSKIDKYM